MDDTSYDGAELPDISFHDTSHEFIDLGNWVALKYILN